MIIQTPPIMFVERMSRHLIVMKTNYVLEIIVLV